MASMKFTKVWCRIMFHTRVIIRGFVRVIVGAGIAGLMGMAFYGLFSIHAENGWTAVQDFVAACTMLTVAIAGTYMIGTNRKVAKRHD